MPKRSVAPCERATCDVTIAASPRTTTRPFPNSSATPCASPAARAARDDRADAADAEAVDRLRRALVAAPLTQGRPFQSGAKQREDGQVFRASGSLLDLDETAQRENADGQLGDAEHNRVRQQIVVDDSVVDRP